MVERIPPKKQLEQRFEYFLLSNDINSLFKIRFKVVYNNEDEEEKNEGYYHIQIDRQFGNKNFDSQRYFMEKYETEEGQSKLAEFTKENNVGLITY